MRASVTRRRRDPFRRQILGVYRAPTNPKKENTMEPIPSEAPVPMCDVKLMESGKFPAKCHRDLGHDGLHRAFVVGGMEPGYWRDGDTETRTARRQ